MGKGEIHRRPLIAHIIHRLDVGGLENGLVNLINHMPDDQYRHAIVCLTRHSDFRGRIRRDDVPVVSLDKREGKDLRVYYRLWKVLRRLRPDILHTRNIGTLDCVLPATLAGVRRRVHGEHGRDFDDLFGEKSKHILSRRLYAPFVHQFVPVSHDFERWLQDRVGISTAKVVRISNGVDTSTFYPSAHGRDSLPVNGFAGPNQVVIGTIGRMDHVKGTLDLIGAFLRLLDDVPKGKERLRLVCVGDGPLLSSAREMLKRANVESLAWLPGSRDDIASLLRGFDLFVLPSLAEGMSNTLLEAMASGLPVIATRVGGNPELVVDGVTGTLIPPDNWVAIADAVAFKLRNQELMSEHGKAARERMEKNFSLNAMVANYARLYDSLLDVDCLRDSQGAC